MREQKVCFVIAPIGDEGSEVRKRSDQVLKHVIEPIARQCGYTTLRADKISKPGVITRQIIEHLLEAPLVVADLAGHNPNVFYELAVRHATRKPVILIRQLGESIPFDVAQNRTVQLDHKDMDSVEECKTRLLEQVRSVEKSSSETDNPISTTLDLRLLRASTNPSQKTDAQILTLLEDIRATMSSISNATSHRSRSPFDAYLRETQSGKLADFEEQIPRDGLSKEREFVSANILKVVARSTGNKGGDWGHGSRHYLSLENGGGTAWYLRVKDEDKISVFDGPEKIEVLLGGDTELETFADSLRFASGVFQEAAKMTSKGNPSSS